MSRIRILPEAVASGAKPLNWRWYFTWGLKPPPPKGAKEPNVLDSVVGAFSPDIIRSELEGFSP